MNLNISLRPYNNQDNKALYYYATKVISIMKLTNFFLLIGFLQVSAKGVSQDVTLSVHDMPVEMVLAEVKKQTGYDIFFNATEIRSAQKVTIQLHKVKIEEALKEIFKDQPFSFKIMGESVSISKISEKKGKKETPAGQLDGFIDVVPGKTVSVQGIVLTEMGEPLSGASIMVRENGKTTLTNVKGEFRLMAVPVNSVLLVSFVGYTPRRVPVKNDDALQIHMTMAVNELDEEVIQAYGKTSHRLATGNISKVTAKDLESQPVMNPLQALEGRVPGLVVTPTNGYASAPYQIIIRGVNSIGNYPPDPLYIIDGVPLTVLGVSGRDGIRGTTGFDQTAMSFAGGQSPFFNLNPSDIESIEVLKDADATAIYGSRGSNGVILISTKKGKAGRTKFDINLYEGVSKVTKNWDMLNTKQYLQMRREAFKNDGITPTTSNAPDLLLWDTTSYTNWQKFIWGNTGKTTDGQINLSGGDAKTTFRIGGSFHNETDISTFSGANKRGAVSFNLSHKTLNDKLAILFTGNYSLTQANMISLPTASTLPPDAPPVFDKKGNLNYLQWNAEKGFYPFASLLQPYLGKTNFLTSNVNFNYQIFKGLSLITSLGYNNAQNSQSLFQPIASQDPSTNPTGNALFGNTKNSNWIIEPQIEYNGLINKGKITALVGGSAQTTTTDGLFVRGNGYTNDALIHTISNAATVASTDNYGEYKYSAIFGRINYNWENTYIVSLNARRDGSSRFGPGKQFGNFGSLGVAWIFTNENWIGRDFNFLSFGKIRGSYGVTGSDQVNDYAYISRWSSNGLIPYDGIAPLVPLQANNTDYHWESNHKFEAALDLGLFKDRFTVEVAFYRNRCDDQLISFPTPVLTGFSNVVAANWPANVQNQGWEFSMNANLIRTKVFSWSVNFNMAINRNRLIAYPNLPQSPYASTLVIGQSVSVIHALHALGVDPQTGQYAFQDKNHDGVINRTPGATWDAFTFDPSPRFSGGFGTNLSYKGFALTAFFYFKSQMGNNALAASGSSAPGSMFNQSLYVFNNRWQRPGDAASVAKFTTAASSVSYSNFQGSDRVNFTDASFIRLANTSISYSLPDRLVRKAAMQGLRVFLNAQNVILITKYKGLDPETRNFGGMPPSKVFIGGLSLNF